MRDESLARLPCLHHNLPTTESRYTFIQVLIFSPFKCEARKLTMQYVHETYIVPALKFNNIALVTVMWLPIPSLHAMKTWSQKKESDPCVMRELATVLK